MVEINIRCNSGRYKIKNGKCFSCNKKLDEEPSYKVLIVKTENMPVSGYHYYCLRCQLPSEYVKSLHTYFPKTIENLTRFRKQRTLDYLYEIWNDERVICYLWLTKEMAKILASQNPHVRIVNFGDGD